MIWSRWRLALAPVVVVILLPATQASARSPSELVVGARHVRVRVEAFGHPDFKGQSLPSTLAASYRGYLGVDLLSPTALKAMGADRKADVLVNDDISEPGLLARLEGRKPGPLPLRWPSSRHRLRLPTSGIRKAGAALFDLLIDNNLAWVSLGRTESPKEYWKRLARATPRARDRKLLDRLKAHLLVLHEGKTGPSFYTVTFAKDHVRIDLVHGGRLEELASPLPTLSRPAARRLEEMGFWQTRYAIHDDFETASRGLKSLAFANHVGIATGLKASDARAHMARVPGVVKASQALMRVRPRLIDSWVNSERGRAWGLTPAGARTFRGIKLPGDLGPRSLMVLAKRLGRKMERTGFKARNRAALDRLLTMERSRQTGARVMKSFFWPNYLVWAWRHHKPSLGDVPIGEAWGFERLRLEHDRRVLVALHPLEVERSDSALSRAAIRKVISANMAQAQACYREGLKKDPSLEGTVVVRLVVVASGAVANAEVAASTLGDAAVEKCLTDRARTWRFPEPRGGNITIITHPFTFSASPGEKKDALIKLLIKDPSEGTPEGEVPAWLKTPSDSEKKK